MIGEARPHPPWRRRRSTADGSPDAARDRACGLLAETANRRAMAWRALALAFRLPNPGWLAGLASGAVCEDLTAVADWAPGGVESLAHPITLVHLAVAEVSTSTGGGLDTAQAEYTRLYDVDRGLVPAAESAYLGEGRRAEVERMYAAHGLHAAVGGPMPADHVAAELEFVYVLCRREESAWAGAEVDGAKRLRRTEREFLRRHLANWAPSFSVRTQAHAILPLYPALAAFLQETLAIETRLASRSDPLGS